MNKSSSYNFNEWVVGLSITPEGAGIEKISSISFGQPEHFDEMVLEITRRMDAQGPWHNAPLYVPAFKKTTLKEKLLNGCVPEVHRLEEAVLVKNLVNFLEVVLNNRGWIRYQNCPSSNCGDHFATEWKTFYNPR